MNQNHRASAPLQGIRVLDLSRVLAGPWCGQMLADLGAEVIKIERPIDGDDSREWGPPFVKDADGSPSRVSAYFASANRGKKSIELDISTPEGQRILTTMCLQSDVLIENFKVGTMGKYGVDYAQLKKLNPRLIFCSITGFGQTGPYRDRPAYDSIMQGLGGMMSITGARDGEPGAGPQKSGVATTDLMTGLYAAAAILGALFARTNTNEGQYIDLSLLDVQVAGLGNMALSYLVSGVPPSRQGTRHPTVAPADVFRCKDGHIMLIVGNDAQFARFCKLTGSEDLLSDSRFSSNAARAANVEELHWRIQAVCDGRTMGEWIEGLAAIGVPCGPINNLAQTFEDPQVVHRGMRTSVTHPALGSIPSVANPIRFSGFQLHYTAPPLLGEHTVEILGRLAGVQDAGEVEALRARGVIGK